MELVKSSTDPNSGLFSTMCSCEPDLLTLGEAHFTVLLIHSCITTSENPL